MAKQTFTTGQVLTAAQMNSLQANDYNWTVDTKTDSYVLVAADAGKRIVMNAATAKTITVNTSIFTAGDVVWIHNINTGTCTVTAGTATVNTAGSLALAQWEGGALYFTSASTAIFFRGGSKSTLSVDVLTVGGGGGGSIPGGLGGDGGGGGAGGFKTETGLLIGKDTYTVTVGAGGAGSTAYANGNGTASSFIISANGGGAGGYILGMNGGSGGGGGSLGAPTYVAGGAGVSGEGNAGGNSVTTGGGGGGGAGGAGGNATTNTGGAGGAASTNSYTGSSISYSGGGGGAGRTTGGTAGTNGGNGGGGATNGSNATANRGGGGGGASYTGGATTSGNGGSGRVVVRWLTADATGLSISVTGTTTNGTDGSYTWYAWDATGTLVVA